MRVRLPAARNVNLAFNDPTNIALNLSSSVANGDWLLLFSGRDEIGNVTPADVARVAAQYFKRRNRTLGRFIAEDKDAKPDRPVIPPAPNLISNLNGYKGRTNVVQGEQSENFEARIKRVTLPKG